MAGVQERVIVVTGAGGGLGREYALLLAAAGAMVVVNDLGGSRDGSGAGSAMADSVVAEIREAGGSATPNYDSVATPEGAQAVVDSALSAFGALHGVVNNAGILRDAAFHKMTQQDWESVQRVHLWGAFFVTRAAWPHFREQRHGRVVMATSTSGIYGNFGQSNYGAAKLGLVGLTNTLAIEGARYNVLTNAVAPMAATRMTADVATDELLDKLAAGKVAPVVGQLLSDELTDSGLVLVVGGGQVHRVQQFQNKGVSFTDTPTIDEVAGRWSDIVDMADAFPGTNPVG